MIMYKDFSRALKIYHLTGSSGNELFKFLIELKDKGFCERIRDTNKFEYVLDGVLISKFIKRTEQKKDLTFLNYYIIGQYHSKKFDFIYRKLYYEDYHKYGFFEYMEERDCFLRKYIINYLFSSCGRV